jgi:hypothetical protein
VNKLLIYHLHYPKILLLPHSNENPGPFPACMDKEDHFRYKFISNDQKFYFSDTWKNIHSFPLKENDYFGIQINIKNLLYLEQNEEYILGI